MKIYNNKETGVKSPEEALAGAMHELTFSLHAELSQAQEDELRGLRIGQSYEVELPDGQMATVRRVDEMGYEVETIEPNQEEKKLAA